MTEWKHNISISEERIEWARLIWEESSTLGSARCRLKRLRRVENKLEIKRRWQRQATRGCHYLNAVFWILVFGNASNAGLHCSVLNGESADVPEHIVVAWSLRFRGMQQLPLHPEIHFQCGRYCYALPYVGPIRVFRGAHVAPRKKVKSLANDHPSNTGTCNLFQVTGHRIATLQ